MIKRSPRILPAPASDARAWKIFWGFGILALIAFGASGCSSTNSAKPGTIQSDYSRQIKEQEKIPGKFLYPKKLPEMTDDDVERLGDGYARQGNLIEAFVQYDALLRKHPGNSRLLYKRGLIFLMKDRCIEALADFQKALKKEPNNARIHEGAGQALFKLKRFDEAQKEFQLALKLDGKLWLSHNFLGIIYDYKHQPALAVEQYQAAISQKPDWGAVYNNLGVSLSLQGKWGKAVAAFEDAIERGYSDPQVGNNLGLALCHLGKCLEAVEAFKRSGDEAQAYNNVGSFYLQQGDYAKAMGAFERAIQLRPAFYPEANENLEKARAALDAQISQNSPSTTRVPKEERGHAVSQSVSPSK